ncbi:hypothetical protein E5288_WYG012077 [Bos mutus]|uniref:Uncharacterized protein n=1 Tax=Bos mutus TaxID=72004 RepID=A0A6B0R6Q2_9CETA|nr:hypothetical protein [Bos mutus]
MLSQPVKTATSALYRSPTQSPGVDLCSVVNACGLSTASSYPMHTHEVTSADARGQAGLPPGLAALDIACLSLMGLPNRMAIVNVTDDLNHPSVLALP